MQRWEVGLNKFLSLVIGVLALAAPSFAQVSASISGRVTDPSGAIVSGATVTVKSLETDATRTVTTNDSGDYTVFGLPLGPQEVTAGAVGFIKFAPFQSYFGGRAGRRREFRPFRLAASGSK